MPAYCESENFEPTCGRQEVVVMEHALYGRMSLGKCVETDYGYVGCKGNKSAFSMFKIRTVWPQDQVKKCIFGISADPKKDEQMSEGANWWSN